MLVHYMSFDMRINKKKSFEQQQQGRYYYLPKNVKINSFFGQDL